MAFLMNDNFLMVWHFYEKFSINEVSKKIKLNSPNFKYLIYLYNLIIMWVVIFSI